MKDSEGQRNQQSRRKVCALITALSTCAVIGSCSSGASAPTSTSPQPIVHQATETLSASVSPTGQQHSPSSVLRSSTASQQPSSAPAFFPKWQLSNKLGDKVTMRVEALPVGPANGVVGADKLTSESCEAEIAKAGIDLDRSVAIPTVISVVIQSPLAVRVEMPLIYTMSVMQVGAMAPLPPTNTVWVGLEGDTCNANTSLYQTNTWKLDAGTGKPWVLWRGWIMFPDVTPNDPQGASSDAHRALFNLAGIRLSGEPAQIDSVSDDPTVKCGATTGLKPIELGSALAAGCTQVA